MDWEEGKIISAPLEEQMKTSYIDYAMSYCSPCTSGCARWSQAGTQTNPLCDAGSWYASGQTI